MDIKSVCIRIHPSISKEFYSLIILTQTSRVLGPSNSHKYMPCQVPKQILPPSMKRVLEEPVIADLMWASALPSACLYPALAGMSLFKVSEISLCTAGSQFSLIVRAAVVCGQNMCKMPSLTFFWFIIC